MTSAVTEQHKCPGRGTPEASRRVGKTQGRGQHLKIPRGEARGRHKVLLKRTQDLEKDRGLARQRTPGRLSVEPE